MPQFRQRRRTGLLYTLLALITVVSTTCVDLPFQPGQTVTASLDVAALLSAAQSSPIPIDAFVVELRRTSDSSVVVNDTIYADSIGLAADPDSVVLDVLVPLETDPEQFYVHVSVIGGGVEWFVVVGVVTASTSAPVSGEVLIAVYVGPGWDGTSLALTPSDTTIAGGDSILVTGTVYRDQTAITGAPVSFASSNESLVPEPRQLGLNQAWLFAPAALTDSVTISATAPTAQAPLTGSALLRFFARPDALVLVSGNNQNMNPGEPVVDPLVVRVLDAAGNPFTRGYEVVFAVASGPTGTSVAPDTTQTDGQGLAQTTLTAGDAAGVVQVTAEGQNLTGSPVAFTASVADVSGPANIIIVAGNNQSTTVATAVTTAPSVMVTDAVGGPVVAEQVVFAITTGGGTLTGATTTTDPSGIATVGSWTLGQTAGANTITATVGGLQPVTFTATGTADVPATIQAISGDDQTGDGGTTLPAPLVVEVLDQFSNAVPSEPVDWVPSDDGLVSPNTGSTDAAGRAQTSWTLGTGSQTQTTTATVSGLQPVTFNATATFSNPTILLALLGADRIAVGGSATLEVTLSEPAAGDVSVVITSDNTGIADVQSPGSVLIPNGSSTGQIGLDGISAGSTTIRGNATGWTEGTVSVDVSPLVLSLPSTLNVPFGGTASIPVQISTPAPVGGETVTLVSSDPGLVAVVTPTVTIPAGLQTANGTLSGVFPGTVTLTGTSAIYGTAQSTVSTTANLNIVQTSATINASFGSDIQVRLESGGSPIAAPTGGIQVTLTPGDPTCAIAMSPVTIPAGLVDVTATVTYGGSATLQCVTTLTAAATDITSDNINVTVNPAPNINLSAVTVGSGLQRSWSGSLGAPNHGGVTVTLTSSNPAVALVAPNASTPGTASVVIPVADGVTGFSFYVQGVEGQTGTPTITARASGFTDGTATVDVIQPGLDLTGISTVYSASTANDDPFTVRIGLPYADGSDIYELQAIRAGGSAVTATVTSSVPGVGLLVTTPDTAATVVVVIGVGQSVSAGSVLAGGVAFDPLAPGTTQVAATITGFVSTTGVNGASRTITVNN